MQGRSEHADNLGDSDLDDAEPVERERDCPEAESRIDSGMSR